MKMFTGQISFYEAVLITFKTMEAKKTDLLSYEKTEDIHTSLKNDVVATAKSC